MKKVITIDGPAGSGKSTLARNLNYSLPDFQLVDMGAYFRWATYLCLQAGLDITRRRQVYNFVKDEMDLEFGEDKHNGEMMVKYRGKIINKYIYNKPRVDQNVAEIPQHYLLRNLIKKNLRQYAEQENVIIAGRDTGTYTFPDAWLKIYLTASFDARVDRRHRDFSQKKQISYEETQRIMKLREHRESKEKDSPLTKPRGAFIIDNTQLKSSETLQIALKEVKKKLKSDGQKLFKELKSMAEKDQAMRKSGRWNERIDQENTTRLKEIIAIHGWPDINLVGEEGAEYAWLLAQHADRDKNFQKNCLEMMKEKMARDLVNSAHVAYLEDRILVHSGQKQKYGTQFFRDDDGENKPQPIIDRKNLDRRRQSVGLKPFKEYLEKMRKR